MRPAKDIDTTLFDYDTDLPLDMQERVPAADRDGVTVRDITYDGGQGQRVEAYLVEPPAAMTGPHPAVLWVHWLETHAEDSNRTQFLDDAIELAREGVVSVLPDAFWSTTPEEFNKNPVLWWKTDFEHDRELSVRQTTEIRRALDIIYLREDVDTGRVVYVGHDFGAMYGSLVLGMDKRIKAAVLMAGTTAFSDWFIFGSKLSEEANQAYVEAMAILDPARYIANAAPAQLLFQFATDDFYVPKEKAEAYVEAAPEPRRLLWYDTDHSMKDTANQCWVDRMKFVREQLESE